MTNFTKQDIEELNHLYKINLINSCSGYKSANLIGTTSETGVENLAVFSSITHLGSSPAILGFFCRPTTVLRHTYNNIKETGEFTINHIHKSIIEQAHHTSAKYPEEISEFEVTGLEAEYKAHCKAPFVKHAPVQLHMKFVSEYPIVENNTILLIGSIEHLYVNEKLLNPDGFIDLSAGEVATINGLDTYAVPKIEKRLTYQRPKPLL